MNAQTHNTRTQTHCAGLTSGDESEDVGRTILPVRQVSLSIQQSGSNCGDREMHEEKGAVGHVTTRRRGGGVGGWRSGRVEGGGVD